MTQMSKFQAPRVWLAPMSGSTDAPFRRQAVRFGAPAVVSEMVAGEQLAAARPDMVRKICRHDGDGMWIVQLAARRPEDMLAGAKLIAEAGVDVVDINMGCPARQVTGGQSGSALMKDLNVATQIIDAALEGAGGRPVTLKMRLGWDDNMLNAPELAEIAQSRGIQMLTVHGRTRCQFYKGTADWARIAETVAVATVPVIANGDIDSVAAAQAALEQSGAHGVMTGRSAMGRPWLLGEIAAALNGGAFTPPSLAEQCDSLIQQIDDSEALYGARIGNKMIRKHVSAAIDHLPLDMDAAEHKALRGRICQINNNADLKRAIEALYADLLRDKAA